ncbi:MAG: MATE family efflux transporter [Alphaproteobacteria bacterium]
MNGGPIDLDDAASLAATDPPWRPEAWATLRLAVPLVFAQVAQIAINTTDVVMMGWLGPAALAGGALGGNVLFPALLFGLGIVSATAPMVAQSLGARQFRAVRRTVRQGFWIVVAYTIPVSVALWYAGSILIAMGQAPANADLAQAYLRAAVWSLAPGLWIVVLRSFVAAHSRPRSVLVVTLLGVVVNAVGDYVLMFGKLGFPALGVVGAGVSTSIVNAFMFLVLFGYVLRDRKFRRYALLARFWRPDWARFREILRLGMPIGLAILAEAGMFSAAALLMGLISTAALAAHAIALQCAGVAFMVPLGISQAATVRVGLAAGAGDRSGVGHAGWSALALGAAFSTVPILAFWLLPEPLVDVFLDLALPATRPVAELAAAMLGVAALFQLVDGAQVIAAGVLRGLKDTKVPMVIAAFGYWGVGFPGSVALGFGLGLGGVGVWLGLALGLAASALMLIHRFHRRDRLGVAVVPAGP